jgi:tRNA (guanine-N(7)-)-methyltransferase subunit TRM82
MPKRPSDITISPDSSTVLVADKFGDVYALPLDPSTTLPSSIPSLTVKHAPEENKPAANEFTVHSKSNLRSLQQQRARDESKQKSQAPKGDTGPTFAHALLLGHVSMLTAITIGEHDDRAFIITADRDEHVRVSRYIPQAYVIEGYCLGHKGFVGCLHIPKQAPSILISGGGDEELFVWDWRHGKLVSRTRILPASTDVPPRSVAVLRVCSNGGQVFVICEG